MDLSESISFQMDTTTDSIDALASSSSSSSRPKLISSPSGRLNHDDEMTRLPPDKIIVVDETPPSSSSSSSPSNTPPTLTPSPSPSSSSSSSAAAATATATATTTATATATATATVTATKQTAKSQQDKNCKTKKSVLFDTVTVYHFNRSQGFISIPSQGGSTLGMKRRHFLRRRLSVDLYEEVRRRSRREILLKIKFGDKRKREEQQQLCAERLHCSSTSSSTSSASNTNTSDSDDESYSDFSDISDSELESDSYIFLQPIGVKLRRSLLRESGVGRIDPKEKKECKIIRESRERSGCRCVEQCIPEYCECSRLGVNCHVDRVSFPCGCVSSGCQNPQGRTEFDVARVRGHFEEKVIKSPHSDESILQIQS